MKQFWVAMLALFLAPVAALAWGTQGHTMINRLAAQGLPATLPAFVRTPAAVREIAYLGPDEDRLKGAGRSWDADNDPGHYLDIGDDLTVFGVVRLSALPPTMEAYTRALEAAHSDPYRAGYVPYTIMDGWEQVRQDFALWRVDNYLASHAATARARASFAAERALRQTLTLADIGRWGHFVADGSQPLHVTVHFNGWGNYPNPNGYSTAHNIHAMFESEFVDRYVTLADVRRDLSPMHVMQPQTLITQRSLASLVGRYLTGTARAVPHLYAIQKAGGFTRGTPQAVDFTAAQLARGASMLRDLITLAWDDSLNANVGYPEVRVRDVLAGKVVPRG